MLMLRLLIGWMIKTDMLNSFDIVVICSLNFIPVETDIDVVFYINYLRVKGCLKLMHTFRVNNV
jgi:hypothetical protein